MENKIDFTQMNDDMENFKELSVKSKDYIKFIVGLSTGTILLSVTLIREFVRFPQYNFILIIGWVLLFFSTILGVWILPAADNFQAKFQVLNYLLTHPQQLTALLKKELRQQHLKELIKASIPAQFRDGEKVQESFKSLDNRSYEDLKKLAPEIAVHGVKDEAKDLMKDVLESTQDDLISLIKIYEDEAYPPNLFKSMKWIVWQLRYLEKGMRYSFFIGMLAILVFSIINLLAKA
jgi:hypothetical protein